MKLNLEYGFQYPFGEESCEHEVEVLQDHYSEYFYDQSRFNAEAIEPDVYLIVGRRGSGKSSLVKYFGFQGRIKSAHHIEVYESEIYNNITRRIANHAFLSPDMAVNDVRKIWEYIIWSLIFNEYCESDPQLKAIRFVPEQKHAVPVFINELLKHIFSEYMDESGAVTDGLTEMLADPAFTAAKNIVLEHTRMEPVIIAIDTFERYDREDSAMMAITAALIQCANHFNITYARRGIHVKSFVSAEIFPYIKEGNITNTTKFIRNPVYMLWKPKDLIRLISWRFKKYLNAQKYTLPFTSVEWNDFNDVRSKMWTPFFGEKTCNARGQSEQSLPYILRHTQMRPRQLVVLCNKIARTAKMDGKFPNFKNIRICDVVAEAEVDLADEVLNSYNRIYPGVADIVTALMNSPAIFKGNYIDLVAKKTSRAWPDNSYTATGFRRLVAELGIVGRMRKLDESTGIIEADFEYAMNDRLVLSDNDNCVIHPMFYTKLKIIRDNRYVVYPFPDHADYKQLREQ